ncbi:helix-turn-helix transcriptional regulator, partial [Phocaeicola vulgatus]
RKIILQAEELLGIHTDHSFIQKVMECHTEAKTAEELAELCGANSTVTFRRTFLRLFNCPVAQWLRQKRAEQVLKLLRTTHLPLPEIAEQCGFANQSYLSDFCKRNLGDTPVNIRRNRS